MDSVRLYYKSSITFPCIGAGTLKYPAEALSKIMVDYVKGYLELTKYMYPLTVKICVYEKDQALIDVGISKNFIPLTQSND